MDRCSYCCQPSYTMIFSRKHGSLIRLLGPWITNTIVSRNGMTQKTPYVKPITNSETKQRDKHSYSGIKMLTKGIRGGRSSIHR